MYRADHSASIHLTVLAVYRVPGHQADFSGLARIVRTYDDRDQLAFTDPFGISWRGAGRGNGACRSRI